MKPDEIKSLAIKTFLGVVFTSITLWIVSLIKQIPFTQVLKWCWNNILEFPVPLWSILGLLLLLYILKKANFKIEKTNPNPEFINYTSESIEGIKWQWKWSKLSNGSWRMYDIKPLCRICGTPAFYEDHYFNGSQASCPRCSNKMTNIKDLAEVEAIVHDNIDRKLPE